ncbi:MAG: efflux RND transporter periplasmic adaptor subunit, partial [Geminicoccaceae bacterium]
TIPLVAVQPGQDGPFVYVVGPDDRAARRQVTVGDTLGDAVVVRDGLRAGDRVVTEGQQRLRDGSRVAERRPAAPAAGKPDQPGPKAAS